MMGKKKHLTAVLCSLLMGCLLVLAFNVPTWVNTIYDSRMLGKINERQVQVEIYQPIYNHFPEKLHSMVGEGGRIAEQVQVLEDETAISNEALTELAQQEVQALINEGLELRLQLEPENLILRKLSTILYRDYGSDETMLSGVRMYKLVYRLSAEEEAELPEQAEDTWAMEREKMGYEITDVEVSTATSQLTLYMDEEYHKLYGFYLETGEADRVGLTREKELTWGEVLAYWGVEEYYDVYLENMSYDAWEQKSSMGEGTYDNLVFAEDGASLPLWMEKILLLEEGGGYLRMGVSHYLLD